MKPSAQDTLCRDMASELACIEDGDSPIDLALTQGAWCFLRQVPGALDVVRCEQRTGMRVEDVRAEAEQAGERLTIWRQVAIGRYAADLLVSVKMNPEVKPVYVVVECDGHEFHERTKQQAAHDKKRDRDLQRQGYAVLRFTGSEIWKSPTTAAREMIAAVLEIAHDRGRN